VSVRTPPDAEEPLPTLEGRAWCFGLRLDAAEILAPTDAGRSPSAARARLFAALDASLAARLADGDVVVAEEYAGEPPYVAPALAALGAAGVQALLGRVVPRAFVAAAEEHGLAALVLDTPSFVHTGDRVRLDLDAAKVVNLSSGDRAPIRNLDDVGRARMRVALTRRRADR
jgi:hypothetical protein